MKKLLNLFVQYNGELSLLNEISSSCGQTNANEIWLKDVKVKHVEDLSVG